MFLAMKVVQQVFVWASRAAAATAWWFTEGLRDLKPSKSLGKKKDRLGASSSP